MKIIHPPVCAVAEVLENDDSSLFSQQLARKRRSGMYLDLPAALGEQLVSRQRPVIGHESLSEARAIIKACDLTGHAEL